MPTPTPLSPLSPAGHNSRRKSPPASMSALGSVDAVLSSGSPRNRVRSRNFTPFDMLYSTPTKDPKAGKDIVIFEDENTPVLEDGDDNDFRPDLGRSEEEAEDETSMVGDDAVLGYPSSPFMDEVGEGPATEILAVNVADTEEAEPVEEFVPQPEERQVADEGMSSPVKKKTRLSESPRDSFSRRSSPAVHTPKQEDTLRFNEGLTVAVDQLMQEKESQEDASEQSEETMRMNEGLTVAVDSWNNESIGTKAESSSRQRNLMDDTLDLDTDLDFNEGMSTIYGGEKLDRTSSNESNDTDVLDDGMMEDENTMGLNEDTCLSTFSAMPDMTQFARLRSSPTKTMQSRDNRSPGKKAREEAYQHVHQTPTSAIKRSHSARDRGYNPRYESEFSSPPAGSPTPRRTRAGTTSKAGGNDPNLILDFTDQFNAFIRPSHPSSYASPLRRRERASMSPNKAGFRTPGKSGHALLDFDIPPAPTPRSIPTITARELESLKSGFMSEISSLRATLSGKEAESASLKSAVTDAERRVGEAMEEVRDLRAAKEGLEMDKKQWDDWKIELDKGIDAMKEDIRMGDRERANLTLKLEDSERKREKSEARIVELQSLLESARAQNTATAQPSTSEATVAATPSASGQPARDTDKEVNDAVEKVARELHTLYKGKHEKKVSALKKSYEARWEKRITELERQVEDARDECARVRAERDSRDHFGEGVGEMTMLNNEIEAERKVLEARIAGLESELLSLKADSESLRVQLEIERTEKGELVATVDEWIGLQEIVDHQKTGVVTEQDLKDVRERAVENEIDTLKRSVGIGARPPGMGMGLPQPGGLRKPAAGPAGESRIGRFGAPAAGHARKKSGDGARGGPAGGAATGNFASSRSGIMSSIERMGRGGN